MKINMKKTTIPISNNTTSGSLPKLFPEYDDTYENDNFEPKNNVLLTSFSKRFNNIYSKYLNSKKRHFYPDLMSLLNDYKNEKLINFHESESMKEEIDEEIKKYKLAHDIIKRKKNIDRKYFSYGSIRRNIKENKFNLIQTFKTFAKDGKITSSKKWKNINEKIAPKVINPRLMFKNEPDLKDKIDISRNKSTLYLKRKNLVDFLETKEKIELKKKNGVSHAWVFGQQKINFVCDNIIEDSKTARHDGKERLNKFNKNWKKYRKLKEFKFPDIQKKKEIINDEYEY